jgi:peptidoglycan hydrolase CwlO-like protein
LSTDNIPEQFKTLEDKVERLVVKCKELQEAKTGLQTTVDSLQQALHEKDASEKKFLEEKSLIRSRMDTLVGRLDRALEST